MSQGEMSHLIFLTKKIGRNQNQGEMSQGEMSQGEMSVREKCLLDLIENSYEKALPQDFSGAILICAEISH